MNEETIQAEPGGNEDWLTDVEPPPPDVGNQSPVTMAELDARVIEAKKAIFFGTADGQVKAQLFGRLQKMLGDLDAEMWLGIHATRLS